MDKRCEIHRVRPKDFLRALRHTPRTILMTGVGTYLATHPGRLVPVGELAQWLYGDRADGGPLDARNCIYAAVRKLRDSGFPVLNQPGRGFTSEAR